MRDQLLVFAAGDARLAVCATAQLAREAASRHALGAGSASALAQALTGTLLLAASERRPPEARVDVQLECGGPLKGLLTDADASGAVRGLVRVNGLDRKGGQGSSQEPAPAGLLRRFDPRPILASGHDERAGLLSVVRAEPGSELHRAAFPFAGADLGAALTLFLRNDRARGGEMALEVLFGPDEPLAAVAGALLWAAREEHADDLRALGKPLRQKILHESLLRVASRGAGGDAHALAEELAAALRLGALQLDDEVKPRFACRCSRERVVRALATLAASELRDMAARDRGAEASCDFCGARYGISAAELLQLAGDGPPRA
jgi:molecular chaperone Hsp33